MPVRRDPFEAMERMFDQMRRTGFGDTPFVTAAEAGGFGPHVSLEPEDEGFVVVADLPGFEREEIDLTYADRTLTIEGVHEDGDGASDRSRSIMESVAIPEDVDPAGIDATYRNGVLEVRLPVDPSDDEGYRIDIK